MVVFDSARLRAMALRMPLIRLRMAPTGNFPAATGSAAASPGLAYWWREYPSKECVRPARPPCHGCQIHPAFGGKLRAAGEAFIRPVPMAAAGGANSALGFSAASTGAAGAAAGDAGLVLEGGNKGVNVRLIIRQISHRLQHRVAGAFPATMRANRPESVASTSIVALSVSISENTSLLFNHRPRAGRAI